MYVLYCIRVTLVSLAESRVLNDVDPLSVFDSFSLAKRTNLRTKGVVSFCRAWALGPIAPPLILQPPTPYNRHSLPEILQERETPRAKPSGCSFNNITRVREYLFSQLSSFLNATSICIQNDIQG